jgi:hypothetical protein
MFGMAGGPEELGRLQACSDNHILALGFRPAHGEGRQADLLNFSRDFVVLVILAQNLYS